MKTYYDTYLLEVMTNNLGLEPFELRVGLSCKENCIKSLMWQWDSMTERAIENSFVSYGGVIGLDVPQTDTGVGLTFPIFWKAYRGASLWYTFRTNKLERSVYK